MVGLPELLATGKTIHVLKINRNELRGLCSSSGGHGGEEGSHDIKALGRHFLSCHPGIKSLAITSGPDEAFLLLPPNEGTWLVYRYQINASQPILSPIGAGDTCSAVMMAFLVAGSPPPQAFLWGLAAATASCYTTENACFTWKPGVVGMVSRGINLRAQWGSSS